MGDTVSVEDGFCRQCGYSLRGLPEHRCPECGTEFDPTDPSTFASQRKKPRQWWLLWEPAVGCLCLLFSLSFPSLSNFYFEAAVMDAGAIALGIGFAQSGCRRGDWLVRTISAGVILLGLFCIWDFADHYWRL